MRKRGGKWVDQVRKMKVGDTIMVANDMERKRVQQAGKLIGALISSTGVPGGVMMRRVR